jgi:hypothetical protein
MSLRTEISINETHIFAIFKVYIYLYQMIQKLIKRPLRHDRSQFDLFFVY